MTVAVTDVDVVAVSLDRALRQVIETMFGLTIELGWRVQDSPMVTSLVYAGNG